MPSNQVRKLDDYLLNEAKKTGKTPAILTNTSYSVDIHSGLAMVSVTRRFENREQSAIEAVMTFPVPFDAVVTGIETVIDGRKLVGHASAKAKARETYETAIDDGKAAILHEELLRGLHMVSVANVKPGGHIDVTARFVTPLSMVGEDARLRIPLTVGQIYGNSPLQNNDGISTDGPEQSAAVTITCAGNMRLNGKSILAGAHAVSLGSVIDLLVEKPELKPLVGHSSDGRTVSLSFGRQEASDSDLVLDVMLDASGSMTETDADDTVKWDAMISGVATAAKGSFKPSDSINLWTFDDSARKYGTISPKQLAEAVERVPFTRCGTKLQESLEAVANSREGANILLITDGKAWKELDFSGILNQGARVTVVLMGTAAFEARVGYLAAMSGGQMFVCFGNDTAAAISQAIRSMRSVPASVVMTPSRPSEVSRIYGGMRIVARWTVSKKSKGLDGVSQFAAFMTLAGLPEEKAALFAAEEGLVTHLTSIVLVDEAGEAIDGIPAQRKVPLSAPLMASRSVKGVQSQGMLRGFGSLAFTESAPTSASMLSSGPTIAMKRLIGGPPSGRRSYSRPMRIPTDTDIKSNLDPVDNLLHGPLTPMIMGDGRSNVDILDLMKDLASPVVTPPAGWTLSTSLQQVPFDWDKFVDELSNGRIDGLPLTIRARVRAVMAHAEVIAMAAAAGRTLEAIAIGLIAFTDKDKSRTADRIQRRHLKDIPEVQITSALSKL